MPDLCPLQITLALSESLRAINANVLPKKKKKKKDDPVACQMQNIDDATDGTEHSTDFTSNVCVQNTSFYSYVLFIYQYLLMKCCCVMFVYEFIYF